MTSKAITITLVLFDLALAASCWIEGCRPKAWYWVSAASITASTLWMK